MSFQQLIAQKKLDISIVELKDLGLAERIDSDAYKVQTLFWLSKVREKHNKKFGELINLLTDYTANGSFASLKENVVVGDEKDFAKWIRIQNLDASDFDNNMRYVNEGGYNFLSKTKLFGGEFLISKTGEYLGKAYILKNMGSRATLADNIFMLTLKEGVLKEYMYIFINTKVGNSFVLRNAQGTGQPTIIKDSLRNIDVPIPTIPFQQKISDLVNQSFAQREQSKSLYHQAEQVLLKELGLENYQPAENNISIKNSGEVGIFSRMDAEFFQPKYDEIVEKISKTKTDTLEHIADYKKGIEPGSEAYTDDENGVPFVRVSDVSINGIDRIEKRISPELAKSYKGVYSPKKGEVLITKDGTIGTSLAITEDIDSILSGAFLRLQPKIKIEQEYLALILNSIVCKLQIERFSGGALIEHLKPGDLMQIQVPILSEIIQQKIADLITQSHQARNESKKLLEAAKRAVEVFIEEDEKKAMEFISKNG